MSEEQTQPHRRRRRGRGLFSLFLLAVFAGAWTALYGTVELGADEVALISRAGRVVRQLEGAGRHVHLPFPIERRSVVSLAPRALPEGRSALVTRDDQAFEVVYRGQYQVAEPRAARFAVRLPSVAVVAAVEGALADLAARHGGSGVREFGARLAVSAQRAATEQLRALSTGLRVTALSLEWVTPAAVAELDAEIKALGAERDQIARAAGVETEALLSAARIRALETATQARLEREALVSKATGEAERFRALVSEYRRAPEVVRTRLYLETMEEVLGNAQLVIAEPGSPLPSPAAPGSGAAPQPEVSAGPDAAADGEAP